MSSLYLFHQQCYLLSRGAHRRPFIGVEISFTEVGEAGGKESYKIIIPSNYLFFTIFGQSESNHFGKILTPSSAPRKGRV